MLAKMHRATAWHRLLLAVLLAVAPLLLAAPFASAADAMHQADSHSGAPCDMPCDGCDQKSMPDCAAKCSAVLFTGLFAEQSAPAPVLAPRIAAVREHRLAGREREPDKPPPRSILA